MKSQKKKKQKLPRCRKAISLRAARPKTKGGGRRKDGTDCETEKERERRQK